MPYVVGTYRDKRGEADCLLSGQNETERKAHAAIMWQITSSQDRFCVKPQAGEHDFSTAWHRAEPAPAAPFVMVCNECGGELHIRRGGFTWDAFHRIAREIWGDAVPLTVAELRLSLPEH